MGIPAARRSRENGTIEEMAPAKRPRPFTVWLLAVLMFFLGIGALTSGPMLFAAPDGHLLQWTPAMLERTPFTSYVIPGIILFALVGVYQVVAGFSMLRLPGWGWPDRLNPYKRYHWAWSASWAMGIILLIWVIAETAMIGLRSLLQPLVAAWGVAEVVLTLLPTTLHYCLRAE